MMQGKSVAVFCGSGEGLNQEWLALARNTGEALAKAGFDLVWGGCNVSMMGEVGRGSVWCGGKVHAVVPVSIVGRGIIFDTPTTLRTVCDLAARKGVMKTLASGFLALPGGFGTWDEFFDVVADQHVALKAGLSTKPIILLNADHFYDPMLAMFERAYAIGMAGQAYRRLFFVVSTLKEAINHLVSVLSPY